MVDFQHCNLHVVGYSAPVQATMPLAEPRPHLFTLPDPPDWIPYRTSYYDANWGFCLSHNQWVTLKEGDYEVVIDSALQDGNLSCGECYLPGRSMDEIFISCHACHPSLANDNLSGLVVATFLARMLSRQERAYSYRLLFIPGTIGAITWLARNPEATARIRHGLVLTCLGDAGEFHYKKSRRGEADIDRAAAHVLRHHAIGSEVLDFYPYGYDERQYCSPGFNLPVGCLMRSVPGSFPEYHTSADNLNFIRPATGRILARVREHPRCDREQSALVNRYPYGEPQLGRRNLWPAIGDGTFASELSARLWVLNFSDRRHTLLEIAERSGIPFPEIDSAAQVLCQNGLLSEVVDSSKEER